MTGKVEWQQGNILVTDITILHQMSGPGTNKNGKRLLHGKPNAINPGVCVHRRCCKWILLRLLFPAAGALGRARWELPAPGCCALCESPLCWAGLAWNSATLNPLSIPPPPQKWTSQQSSSPSAAPPAGSPFPDWCHASHRSGFPKHSVFGWTHTLPVPRVGCTQGLLSQVWRTPELQAVS